MKKLFNSVLKFIKTLFTKEKPKSELDFELIIKERDRLNELVKSYEEAKRLERSKELIKRSKEIMDFDGCEDKMKYHNEVLLKARQELSDVKIKAPLIVDPENIIGHNENIVPTNPSINEIKKNETDGITKQLKGQAKRKNRVENILREAKDGSLSKIITTGE